MINISYEALLKTLAANAVEDYLNEEEMFALLMQVYEEGFEAGFEEAYEK